MRRAFQYYFGMGGDVELTDPSLDHPALARPRTSDYQVFRQVCIWREYQPLAELSGIDSILDLGAKVGYISAFLLSRFPSAKCLSVEPDPGNFRLIQRNLEPYGDRAKAIRGGAWNKCCYLAVAASPYRGGAEWTRQVEERPAGGPDSFTRI